jgi:uncharacterized membrane protein YhaH (DUF805 family)
MTQRRQQAAGAAKAAWTVIGRYTSFEGRVGRGAYWLFVLTLLVAIVAATIVADLLSAAVPTAGTVFWLALLATALWLSTAMTVRRLHDIGWSGWAVLLKLVPFGGILLLVLTLLPSADGPNKYGPHPNNRAGHPDVASHFA